MACKSYGIHSSANFTVDGFSQCNKIFVHKSVPADLYRTKNVLVLVVPRFASRSQG
jgi:hypothetical protein